MPARISRVTGSTRVAFMDTAYSKGPPFAGCCDAKLDTPLEGGMHTVIDG